MKSISKRFLASLLTLLSVLVLTFVLVHTIPGGPFDQERQLPPEIEQNLYEKYGLQKRDGKNFWVWMGGDLKAYASYLARGELGPSLKYRDRDVGEIIYKALGPSFELGIYAMSLSIVAGLLLGLLAVLRPEGFVDRLITILSSLLVSFPSFVMAVFLVLFFSFILALLPPALWEGFSHRILPVLTLAAAPIAYIAQLTRNGLITQLKQEYIKTAKAKGLSHHVVLLKHALRNAAMPVLTILGPMTAYLITGSFIVETIFVIPGLGQHFITAVIDRDYFLVMGITMVLASILILLNWLVDVGYLVLDPRLRKES